MSAEASASSRATAPNGSHREVSRTQRRDSGGDGGRHSPDDHYSRRDEERDYREPSRRRRHSPPASESDRSRREARLNEEERYSHSRRKDVDRSYDDRYSRQSHRDVDDRDRRQRDRDSYYYDERERDRADRRSRDDYRHSKEYEYDRARRRSRYERDAYRDDEYVNGATTNGTRSGEARNIKGPRDESDRHHHASDSREHGLRSKYGEMSDYARDIRKKERREGIDDQPKILRRTRWDSWIPSPRSEDAKAEGGQRKTSGGISVDEKAHEDSKSDRGIVSVPSKDSSAATLQRTRVLDAEDDDNLQRLWSKSLRKQASQDTTDGPSNFAKGVDRKDLSPREDVGTGNENIAGARKERSPTTKLPARVPPLVERLGISESASSPVKVSATEITATAPLANNLVTPGPLSTISSVLSPSGKILLPHELCSPGNQDKKPRLPSGKVVEPYRVTLDPALKKPSSTSQLTRTSTLSVVPDPRDHHVKRKIRREFHRLRWKWDAQSTLPKPAAPPQALVITGLSKLITQPQVTLHFKTFGRIEESELRMDPATGQSLGIYYVRFVHDYDEDLRLLPSASSRPQRADKVCRAARAKLDGQKIGTEVVSIQLDDAEKTTFAKTYNDVISSEKKAAEAARKRISQSHDSLQASLHVQDPQAHMGQSTKGSNTPHTPSFAPTSRVAPILTRTIDPHRITHDAHSPYRSAVPSYSSRERYSQRHRAAYHDWDDEYDDVRDSWHARSHYTQDIYSGSSRLRYSSGRDNSKQLESKREETTSKRIILEKLVANDLPYVFIPQSRSTTLDPTALHEKLSQFGVAWTGADSQGWYVAFKDRSEASRCQMVLSNKSIDGYRIRVEVQTTRQAKDALSQIKSHSSDQRGTQSPPEKVDEYEATQAEKTSWNEAELLQDSMLLLLHELGDLFVRDLRTRIVKPFLSTFIQQDSAGGRLINAPVERVNSVDEIDLIDFEAERPKTFNRAKREEDRLRKIEAQRAEEEAIKQAELQRARELAKAARAAKRQTGKANQARSKGAASLDATKTAKKGRAGSPTPDLEDAGIVGSDDEDYYFARIALEQMQCGNSVFNIPDDEFENYEDDLDDDDDELPLHSSGSARTEGYYRVKPEDKAKHLPDRNRAVVDVHQAAGLASARDNRADSRRFVQGIEQHKKETATDTDILKFNQLRSRKKQLKFAKSPIHDWGLYAMEIIPAGDMIIEYVGEIVRQQVADEREKNYERQGNFSTYLFRVDDDIVVDATKKGNIARLMNHCCTPNCNAKILTLNGEKRIVLYAKETILPGQELTYDYKFQGTGDDEDAIACLCGSDGCRRFL